MSLMCGGGSNGAPLSEDQKAADKATVKGLEDINKKDRKPIKMLLLGAGESGKSTIFKQMKVINKDGYSEKERKEFKEIVYSNTIQSMKAMLDAMDKLDIPKTPEVQEQAKIFLEGAGEDDVFSAAVGGAIKALWDMEVINKTVFLRRSEFQLNDSADYYFERIDSISDPNYIPNEQDVLRSRVRTTGIVQSDFEIKKQSFAMFDVGGQRNERRKWIHCFDNVDAVVFVAALSEFDQMLFEDNNMNRIDEAVSLFKQIVNSKWFNDSNVILFLNKKDLFEKKLKEKEYAKYVNDTEAVNGATSKVGKYTGKNEMEPCAAHFKSLMLCVVNNKDKSIFSHITTATDTGNVKFVFNAVVAMILEENLKSSGLAG